MQWKLSKLAGGVSRASALKMATRLWRWLRRALVRATRSAASDTSASTTRQSGAWLAMASPTQPLPVHKSSTRAGPSRPFRYAMAWSARTQVSSRGMSTSRVMVRGSP